MSSESIPSNTDPYEWYSAFPLLPNVSIRLIRLLPLQVGETDDADLACEQLLYCLEPPERVDYVALSYTWGNPTRDKPIVDKDGTEHLENDATGPRKTRKIYYRGRGLPITQNLYDLLVLIRHREHHGWLWADAICINQDDITERGWQVLLMSQIYSKATTVFIWLGKADEHTELAWTSIKILGTALQYFLTEEVKALINSNPINDSAVWGSLGITEFKPAQWRALGILLTRCWFTRVWTLQEAALGQYSLVWCGGYSMDHSILRRVALFLFTSQWYKIPTEAVKGYHLKDGWDPGFAVQLGLSAVAQQSSHGLEDNVSRRLTNWQCVADALYTFVTRPLVHEATDRRDFIYALLPLASLHRKLPHDTMLKPDYSKPFQLVWAEATLYMINELEDLNILAHAQSRIVCVGGTAYEEHAVTVDGLPSWVPLYDRRNLPYLRPQDFDAMGERKHVGE
jgi:hypothetical protein